MGFYYTVASLIYNINLRISIFAYTVANTSVTFGCLIRFVAIF